MKRKIVIVLLVLLVICAVLVLSVSMTHEKELDNTSVSTNNKPIILIVVDSLMSEPLQKAIKEGKAPAFEFLINNGYFKQDMVSSYPTMSMTIDSSLLTGTYPDGHKVPGLIWFNENENRMISYGSGLREIWDNGAKNVLLDSVIHLNKNHLSKEVQTIYEVLANRNLPSASVNGLIYRGNFEHELNIPRLISMTNLLPKEVEINGPTLLSLGALSQYNPANDRHKFLWNRLGFNNQFASKEITYLFKQKKLPPFTLAYFPDADASIHKHGPDDLKGIEKADKALQDILNHFPKWEEAIQQVTFIVLGDSGQSNVGEDKDYSLINLNKALKSYSVWERKNKDAQLAIAINERMAYIYVMDQQLELQEIVDLLTEDERIGFIAWRDEQTNYVVSSQSTEVFTFSPNGPYVDGYEQSWRIDGDVSILDLKVTNDGRLQYEDYPDALARLHGALHSQEGRVIIVDAKPSFEFIEEHSHDHAGGGAHGSLHKVDSVVPMIVSGTNEYPPSNRLVDIKKWILQLLGDS